MSALQHIADLSQTSRGVRKVPLPDSCTAATAPLLDHLVGESYESRRNLMVLKPKLQELQRFDDDVQDQR